MTINLDQYTNTLNVTDTATNADLSLTTKGTGSHNLNTGNGTAFRVSDLSGTIVAALGVFAGSSSQNSVYLVPYGSVTNGNMIIAAKGSQFVGIGTNTNNNSNATEQMRVTHTASAVNYVQVTGAATGNDPTLSVQGSDTNINFAFVSKGSSIYTFASQGGSSRQFRIDGTSASVNYLNVSGSGTGSAPALSALGTDTNIDLAFTPKGTGNVRFGTYTANTALTIQGYVEIKDSGGTVRRLAVIA